MGMRSAPFWQLLGVLFYSCVTEFTVQLKCGTSAWFSLSVKTYLKKIVLSWFKTQWALSSLHLNFQLFGNFLLVVDRG